MNSLNSVNHVDPVGRPRPRTARRVPGALAAAAALALLAACAGGRADAAAERPAQVPRQVPAGTALVVADQSQQLQTVLAASGQDAELAADVRYANFTGGPAILEAFRAGAADLATVGDTPPIQALASGADVRIVAARRSSPDASRLAVAPGAGVRTLEDLRGKRIAYAEGTAQQSIVLRALAGASLRTSDVELVRLQLADFPDAVRTGQVDVAVLGEPNLTRFLDAAPGGSALPVEETAGTATGLSYLYARGEALDDPATSAAIADYATRWVAAWQWVNGHREEWVQRYYVENQDVSAEDGRRIVETGGTITFPPLDEDLVAVQQSTIDTIAAAGELPVDDLDARDGFDLRYAPVAADAVAAAAGLAEPVPAPVAVTR
ncbi:ABC transporter substrate-binding protein [Kineococcus sp. SYSU DK005]|uniref:ABC transporter substrate-binding protein n=1 Tax=Kineococcus sp. SYSU DK005 TaxID=3383126 RepID=UPI003D7EA8EE